MYDIVLLIHVLLAVLIIGLVLLQQSKGADIGAAFGSGGANTIFGSAGSGNFLSKLTGLLAAGFFATSLSLGYIASQQARSDQGLFSAPVEQQQPVTTPGSDVPDLL